MNVVYSEAVNKFASCGDDGVRVVDMSDWNEVKEDYRSFTKEEGAPLRLQWTIDGQILSVVTDEGYLFNYLTSIPVVGGCFGSKMVIHFLAQNNVFQTNLFVCSVPGLPFVSSSRVRCRCQSRTLRSLY